MVKEPLGFVDIDFTYTDEYGNRTCLIKTVESNYMGEGELGVLNDLFHDFLLACGFSYLADKRVEWVEDER